MQSKNSIRILQPQPKRTPPKKIWLFFIVLLIIGILIIGFFISKKPTKIVPSEYNSLNTPSAIELAPSKMADKITDDENYFKVNNKHKEAPPLLIESTPIPQLKITPSINTSETMIKKEKLVLHINHVHAIDDINAIILLELDLPLKEVRNMDE